MQQGTREDVSENDAQKATFLMLRLPWGIMYNKRIKNILLVCKGIQKLYQFFTLFKLQSLVIMVPHIIYTLMLNIYIVISYLSYSQHTHTLYTHT